MFSYALPAVLACLALAPCLAQTYQSAGLAVISGHVFYNDGKPVKDAEVEVHTFGPVGGILPKPVHTNQSGYYYIEYPPLGPGVISASKPSEGFSNGEWALYAPFKSRSIKSIDLQPGIRLRDIDLYFGEPYAIIEFVAVDAASSLPIRNAGIAITLEDDQSTKTILTIPANGKFLFALPKRAVTVEVTAPGYIPWKYKNQRGAATLLKPPGSRTQIQVLLKPR